jgi:hypothetical protein
LKGLVAAGLLVRLRRQEEDAAIVGYAVALPGDRGDNCRPIFFGGGRLAADLSWPKLAARWSGGSRTSGTPATRLTPHERTAAWRDATAVASSASIQLRSLIGTDAAAASDLAYAAADVISVTSRVVEGRRNGPLTAAADDYDRAARELYGRIPAATPSGEGLRAVARLLALVGRAGRDETRQVLTMIVCLVDLAEAVAQLRDVQQRTAQAEAARTTARRMRAALPPSAAESNDLAATATAAAAAASAPSSRLSASVHRPTRPATRTSAPRRRVQP